MATANLICKWCGGGFTYTNSPANIAKKQYCSPACVSEKLSQVPPWDQAMRERLAARQKPLENGCIEYTGQSWGKYGQLEYKRKTYLAHRAAWELEHGPIPPKMVICHQCDNPKCINVAHLFLGTYSDNVQDMLKKGRAKWNPARKLSAEQIATIKTRAISGENQRRLGAEFGVCSAMVSMIKTGRRHPNTI